MTAPILDLKVREARIRCVNLTHPFERDPRKMFPTMHKAIQLAKELEIPATSQHLKNLQKIIDTEEEGQERDDRWEGSDLEEEAPPSKKSRTSPLPMNWVSDAKEDCKGVM